MFGYYFNNVVFQRIKWRKTHRKIEKCTLDKNTFFMGECIERRFAVVTSHAAVADSAERQIRTGQLHDSIIDTASAEA